MSSLPVERARAEVELLLRNASRVVSREETQGILYDLALIVPRANLNEDAIIRMVDLYHKLWSERGLTAAILQKAAEAYVMRPKKGKPRYFPDPGDLLELAEDLVRENRQKIEAWGRGLQILNGEHVEPSRNALAHQPFVSPGPLGRQPQPPLRDEPKVPFRSAAEILAAHGKENPFERKPQRPQPRQAIAPAGRVDTNASELVGALAEKLGATPEELKQQHPLT